MQLLLRVSGVHTAFRRRINSSRMSRSQEPSADQTTFSRPSKGEKKRARRDRARQSRGFWRVFLSTELFASRAAGDVRCDGSFQAYVCRTYTYERPSGLEYKFAVIKIEWPSRTTASERASERVLVSPRLILSVSARARLCAEWFN